MDYSRFFPDAKPDDLCLTFGAFEPGELPLKQACIKTEARFEDLDGSMVELGNGIMLAVQYERCCNDEQIFRPLNQRGEELESYRKCGCTFRRNGDPNSNFLTVAPTGDGTIWICNKGSRSLRFQMPDGAVYRVCVGATEALIPSNVQAQVAPTQILLDLGDNPLDLQISAVYVKYGQTTRWQQCGVDCWTGARVDGSFIRVLCGCGDDCLGVLESYSDYFLEAPGLTFLDISSYGPSQWYVRNKGGTPLSLRWPDGRTAEAPADGQVYRLEALVASGEEANV